MNESNCHVHNGASALKSKIAYAKNYLYLQFVNALVRIQNKPGVVSQCIKALLYLLLESSILIPVKTAS